MTSTHKHVASPRHPITEGRYWLQGDHGVRAIQRAADVATKAAEDTKSMLAMRGRAAYTGERSIGSVDAGATAIGVILQAISAAWREKYGEGVSA